jgi:glycosyltransferase involved in cell wall biosynthesis
MSAAAEGCMRAAGAGLFIPTTLSRVMKLLFAHECFGALAGAEANLFHTAAGLRERGHEVAILHGAPTGRDEVAWRELFIQRFPLAGNGDPSAVMAALRQFDPDAVYIHKLADLDVLETLLASEVPLVRMVHDHDLYCLRSSKYHYFSRHICHRPASLYCLFPCCGSITRNRGGGFPFHWNSYRAKKREIHLNRQFQRLLVATRYMKEELLRNGFEAGRIEIHAPVPRSRTDDLCSTFGDRNLILYAGQIIRGKGVDVLLESLALVRAPFECIILGDGHHRGYCEQLSRKLGLAGRVRFPGFISQSEIRNYYRECSVAVMSSLWPEPFGASGLEAMRFGLPVVAFDAGGISEWLVDGCNGFLVPWMDRASFAARVETLLQDKALARQMGEQGRWLASENYDFAKYIAGLEAMFGRVVAESGKTACV